MLACGEYKMSEKENSPPATEPSSAGASVTSVATENVDSAVDAELEKEKLLQELTDAHAKAQANWDLLLRSKAETENIRRRGQADVEKAQKFCIEGFARELLNVVDSLDKALELTTAGNDTMDAMQQGMQLTHKLLLDTLDKFGIKEINPLGEMFDPAKHEALSMQETATAEPNSILMVVQKGFLIYERILRPARVIVAKASTVGES